MKCYTCSCTEDDSDASCADNVESLGTSAITDCDKKYCTITRVDYKDPKGKLQSINRNCVDKLNQPDGITEDESYRSYSRSCKQDLCNNGTGKGSSSSRGSSLGDKSTIYAPGIGSSSSKLLQTSIFLILITILTLLTIQ